MTKTLLDGVNDLFKRTKYISGDAGALTNLVDSARQLEIDNAVFAWNDVIEEIYSITDEALPQESAENTITLVSGIRSYALPADLVQIRWPLQQQTDGYEIYEYGGGYEQMRIAQNIPSDYTGRPYFGAIDPRDGKLYLDRIPTSNEDGDVYNLFYDKTINITNATDTFPFADVVYRNLVPAAVEVWRYYMRNQFVEDKYKESMSRASRYLSRKQKSTSYLPKRMPMLKKGANPFA